MISKLDPEPTPTHPFRTMPLTVAIYDNPGIKHWSLFLDAPSPSQKTTIHILGGRQRYFPRIKQPSDIRASSSVSEILVLCEIEIEIADGGDNEKGVVEMVKGVAAETEIRNHERDYSCQDYVLDVLGGLEREGIVDGMDEGYRVRKMALMARREAWGAELQSSSNSTEDAQKRFKNQEIDCQRCSIQMPYPCNQAVHP
ncbi:hypothetical protein BJX70DRAFT_397322 [Aspergillus crustosus]